jgi:predicted Zn-dependent protease with MMP-like domain
MHNVEILVEDEPDARQRAENERSDELLGLYEGVPLTQRSQDAPLLPDRITIFRLAVEALSSSPAEQRDIVRRTVTHELAHHFGISDDRLHELGLGDE